MPTGTLAAVALAALLAGGCAPSTLYQWGEYQALLYDMYAEPGNATPEKQAEILANQIDETQVAGRLVPPGVHAHLGYMYFLLGDDQAATRQFMKEKAAFPESAVFIDGILDRLAQRG